MVKLHVKSGDQSQFLYDTTVNTKIDALIKDLVTIYNGRLKVNRICAEVEELSKHGAMLPQCMQGLTIQQISELKLKDEWLEQYIKTGSFIDNPDPIGRRNGKAPNEKLAEVLTKTAAEANAKVSKKLVDANTCLTKADVQDALDMLKGAIMIVYPMNLPPHDPVRQELENKENLSSTQAANEVLDEMATDLWWAGKQLDSEKVLSDFIGKNEKSKLIVKLQKKGRGPPGREPILSEEQRKTLMLEEYKRREALKKLEDADDDSYLDSEWADNKKLQKSFQGLNDIRFNFR